MKKIGVYFFLFTVLTCGFAFAQHWGPQGSGTGSGDMTKAVYDANANDVVDTATTLIPNATITTPTLTSPRFDGTVTGSPTINGTVSFLSASTLVSPNITSPRVDGTVSN